VINSGSLPGVQGTLSSFDLEGSCPIMKPSVQQPTTSCRQEK
jgi:hypothetical protein